MARTRSSRGKVLRGPNEHQPTGSSPAKASTPWTSPASTRRRNAWRFFSPLHSSHSLPPRGTRGHMHQQPPQAPLDPNNFSITAKSSVRTGRTVMAAASGVGLLRAMTFSPSGWPGPAQHTRLGRSPPARQASVRAGKTRIVFPCRLY
jgi:hypothetical protein